MFGMIAATLGASAVSGVLGAKASKDAAKIQAGAADRAEAGINQRFEAVRSDLAPFRDSGVSALQRLMRMTGLSGSSGDPEFGSLMKDFSLGDFAKDPGYTFRQQEGETALTRAAAARGLSKSTPGLRSLMRFNQDLASNEFGAAFSRDQVSKGNKFNLLSWLAGAGQNAAAQTGTAGMNAATASADAAMTGAAGSAAGVLGAASSMNNAIQGGVGNYLTMSRFDEMMKRMPVFGKPA